MEFMQNGSVEDALSQANEGKSPAFWSHTNIAKMLIGLILGMKYLHSKDVIHGNLQPGKLLIDDRGQLHIAGYGLGSREDDDDERPMGTVAYMAPEILDGGRRTKKVDVFAFGLILYEILVGKSVFPKTESPMQIVKLHMQDARPPIPTTIHSKIRHVIQKCWSKNPAERPTFDEIFDNLATDQFPFFADVDMAECKRFIDWVTAEARKKK
jgi:serine/threonine protein kinase